MNGARLVQDSLEFSGWDVRIADAQLFLARPDDRAVHGQDSGDQTGQADQELLRLASRLGASRPQRRRSWP
jgi:hypothetical protein